MLNLEVCNPDELILNYKFQEAVKKAKNNAGNYTSEQYLEDSKIAREIAESWFVK